MTAPHSYGLLSLLFVFFLSAGSFAQPQSQVPSCEMDPRCQQFADAAFEASQQGRFDDAKRAYEQAYQQQPDPELLYNLARVMHKGHRPAAAVPYYQQYQQHCVAARASAENCQKAQRYLEQAQSEAIVGQPPSLPPAHTPLYRRWWLWTAVGVVVAGVAVGVGLGVASRRPDLTGASIVQPF